MEKETITLPKQEYEELLKVISIIKNSKIIESIEKGEYSKKNLVQDISIVEESLLEIWDNEEDERWNEC